MLFLSFFLLSILSLVIAGVQRGECYCNVGVCYKQVEGRIVICQTENDFRGKSTVFRG